MSGIIRIEMANCENQMMMEITTPGFTRRDVAKSYALSLRSSECDGINWAKVNQAIIERWSPYALEWIKKQAWSGRCFEPDRPKGKREAFV